MAPLPDWEGKAVYVIGGGPSLRGFDFRILRCLNTLGCNHAFRLGPDVCKVCIFGDLEFLLPNQDDLRMYPGPVVTNNPSIPPDMRTWMYCYGRRDSGLGLVKIAHNGNTGAAAINLALMLGAVEVNLLGFDMASANRANNWHSLGVAPPPKSVYFNMIEKMKTIPAAMYRLFPGSVVTQLVERPSLGMRIFPTQTLDDHFGQEWRAQNEASAA